ncbi:MAG TPA: PASTA domain-containing protein [Streptosporangiaceae bacterium]|nr:PASTA domain-containing protein [Streptosporangiaceae bacterium]
MDSTLDADPGGRPPGPPRGAFGAGAADPLTGRLLDGRYAVSARLAHGGMATVYLAMDTRLDRQVALKVMHAELARDEDFVQRFIGEAKSVARLSHQNVVAVYDQGADGPFLYLAMEYVPGQSLKDLLRAHGRFGVRTALEIMAGVLDGLAAAHAAGIAHRDIKPENVLITADGRVKVADFGLARAHAAAGHTRTGTIIGSVAYLAPEQVSGAEPAGSHSDVYSAGVLLYELLTGRQPFTGETPISVAYQHVNSRVPPPSALAPDVPVAVDELVLAATSREPVGRPADAGQFLHMLRQVGEQLGFEPAPGASPALDGLQGSGLQGSGLRGSGLQGIGEAPWLGDGTGPIDDGRSHTLIVHREEAARHGRDPLLGRWLFSRRLIVVTVAVAALVLAGIGGWWFSSGRYVSVPAVAGDTVADATTVLTSSGFKVGGEQQVDSNTVPKGQVAGTSPSGRALRGAIISLQISAGPFTSAVPAVRGETVAMAESALRGAHLQFVTEQVGSTQPKGTVLGTKPKAGTVWPQTKAVTLLVAGGLPLPNLVGMTEDAARQIATTDHITLNAVLDTNSNQPASTITSQSPGPGSILTQGETVTVKVSEGPQDVQVPYVLTMPVGQARKILEQAGFRVVVNGPDFFGRVILTDPNPFQTAPFGSVVIVTTDGFGNGNGNGNGNGGGGF